MNRRIFSPRSIAISGGIALLIVVLIIGAWLVGPWGGPRLTIAGGGGTSVGPTSVQYVQSERGLALVIWCDGNGRNDSGSKSGLFGSSVWGHLSSAAGKRIDWEWHAPREKGGDFRINGTPYDLAKGSVILVSTKGDALRVQQLDVDPSTVQPNQRGLEALANREPTIAKFIAEASRKK